jgi:hypothetical protein
LIEMVAPFDGGVKKAGIKARGSRDVRPAGSRPQLRGHDAQRRARAVYDTFKKGMTDPGFFDNV